MDQQVRPIDADSLKTVLDELLSEYPRIEGGGFAIGGIRKGIAMALRAVGSAPTLDYAPVRHGYWIPVWYDLFKLGYVKCSVCGHKEKKRGFAYCHCGALMDGKEDAES